MILEARCFGSTQLLFGSATFNVENLRLILPHFRVLYLSYHISNKHVNKDSLIKSIKYKGSINLHQFIPLASPN